MNPRGFTFNLQSDVKLRSFVLAVPLRRAGSLFLVSRWIEFSKRERAPRKSYNWLIFSSWLDNASAKIFKFWRFPNVEKRRTNGQFNWLFFEAYDRARTPRKTENPANVILGA